MGTFSNNELRMADVEWPGEKANPPQGTADKFHVRVCILNYYFCNFFYFFFRVCMYEIQLVDR